MTNDDSNTRCPIRGVGVVTYDCGHQVVGSSLKRADESLDVERRDSAETAAPLPDDDPQRS